MIYLGEVLAKLLNKTKFKIKLALNNKIYNKFQIIYNYSLKNNNKAMI
jgi:hypothetical protein